MMKLAYLVLFGSLYKALAESTEASTQVGDAKEIEHRFLALGFFPTDEQNSASTYYTKKTLPSYGFSHHLERPVRTDLSTKGVQGKGKRWKGVVPNKQELRTKTPPTTPTSELTVDKKLWQRDSDPDKQKWLKRNEEYQTEALKIRGGGYWKQMNWKNQWKGGEMGTTKAPDGKGYVKGKGEASKHTWTMWKVKSTKLMSKTWSGKGNYKMWKGTYKGKGTGKWRGKVWKGKQEPEPVGVWFRQSPFNATSPPSLLNATDNPTIAPATSRPTRAPTLVPTRAPIIPTSTPTRSPISVPAVPQPTSMPTLAPTAAPVPVPAEPQPTLSPTFAPTVAPVAVPTEPDETSPPSVEPVSESPR
eukprot:scaffold583_cov176-Amphora_coffeaeformis.AAC.3